MSKGEFILAVFLLGVLVIGFAVKEFGPEWGANAPVRVRLDGSKSRAADDDESGVDTLARAEAELRARDASAEAELAPDGGAPAADTSSDEARTTASLSPTPLIKRTVDEPYVAEPYPETHHVAVPPDPAARLDINTGTVEDLMQVPGFGQVLAERIVRHRSLVGGFASMDDLHLIEGLGPTRLQDLESYFTLRAGEADDRIGGAAAEEEPPEQIEPHWSEEPTDDEADLLERAGVGSAHTDSAPDLRLGYLPTPGSDRVAPYEPERREIQPTPVLRWKRD